MPTTTHAKRQAPVGAYFVLPLAPETPGRSVPPLLTKPRHGKPRELPAAKAILVPLVLTGCTGTALGGLSLSASASPSSSSVAVAAAAASSTAPSPTEVAMLEQRQQEAEQRTSRDRVRAEAAAAAAQAEAARLAAEAAARAEAERLAAEAAAAKAAADKAAAEAASRYARPAVGRVTSSYGPRWGRMHRGLDIAAGTGSPIRAAAAGTVLSARTEQGYGRAIRIRHADGAETLYAHNSAILVSPGEKVAAGQQIAREGATGNVTGPHLHFEVRIGGRNVNPGSWLKERGAL